jgi:hypothetical protein
MFTAAGGGAVALQGVQHSAWQLCMLLLLRLLLLLLSEYVTPCSG